MTPHPDVASGRYQQAEFAADLWQVHLGEGARRVQQPDRVLPPHLPDREPEASCWSAAFERSRGKGGDPVVQLQTNFGGGKTHSMLALYHLFSGAPRSDLPGVDAVIARGRASKSLPKVEARRARRQQDLAGQPGHEAGRHRGPHALGRAGLAAWRQGRLQRASRGDDEKATNPGDVLRELFTSTARA